MTPFSWRLTLRALTHMGCHGALLIALGSACGGKGFSASDQSSEGGSGSQGGTTTHAGKSGSANQGGSQAGSGVGGTTNVGGGLSAGAAGSSPNDGCGTPPVQGACMAAFEHWFNDPSTGICTPWLYGGCGANQNNYESLEQCQKACTGGCPNLDACQQPSDCIITDPGRCALCDGTDLTLHDVIAYNPQLSEFNCGVAQKVAPPGQAGACTPCLTPAPLGTLKYLVPTCLAGQCGVADLRSDSVTACRTHDDCRLRRGIDCCESCSDDVLIAVRNDGSFEKLVCGNAPRACPECAPAPVTGAIAACVNDHCQVAYSSGGH